MEDNIVLNFKVSRALVDMGKLNLILLDELCKDSQIAKDLFFNTLEKCDLKSQQVELLKSIYEQSEVLNPSKKLILRKRILDFGNDIVRSIDQEFNKFNIQIKT